MNILPNEINKIFLILFCIFCSTEANAGGFNYLPLNHNQWQYSIEENDKAFIQDVYYEQFDSCHFAFHTESIRKTSYFYIIKNDSIFLAKIHYSPSFLPIRLKITPNPPILNFYADMHIGDEWQWQGSFDSVIKNIPVTQHFEIINQKSLINHDGNIQQQITLCILTSMKGEMDTTVVSYTEGIGLVEQKGTNQSKKLLLKSEQRFLTTAQYLERDKLLFEEKFKWYKIYKNLPFSNKNP